MHRWWAYSAAAISVLLLASGCTLLPTPPPRPTPSPTPEPSNVPDFIGYGEVATGELRSADGADLGPVTVQVLAGEYHLMLPTVSLDTAGSGLLVALSDASSITVTDCAEDNLYQAGLDPEGTDHVLSGATDYGADDPSFWSTVIYVRYPDGTSVHGCTQPILALASLTWTAPVQRPWAVPRDSGATTGATGAVEAGPNGSTYTTAPNDDWSAIAARFGLSEDDLEWLNPIRLGRGERSTAYASEVLNLDLTNRGNSESRRPR